MKRPARIRVARSPAFTLIEMLLVIVLIGILSAVATRTMDGVLDNGRWDATTQEMDRLAWAIAGNPDLFANGVRTDFGYVGDVGALPPDLDALVANPGGYVTWRGPYIRNEFTQDADDHLEDAWGHAYTYAGGVNLTSQGSGGNTITRAFADAAADLLENTVQGVVTDGLGNAPGSASASVAITLSYPDGAGDVTTSTTSPNGSGNYAFSAMVPQGVRTLTAVCDATGDTLVRTAVVLPRSTCLVDFRFRGNLWSAGGTGGAIAYLAGTAGTQSSGSVVFFQLRNLGSQTIAVSSLETNFAAGAWYERVDWGATTVADSSNPRWAPGDVVPFGAPQSLPPGASVTVYLRNFRDAVSGGAAVDMTGTSFTVEFSDGSVLSFAV